MSGPQPTPQPGPTPTPTVSLPQVPSNTYELLSSVADAIDTANGEFNTHATKLTTISQDTNGAVNNVTSNSSGYGAKALSDIWNNSQTDVNRAHDPLTGIVANSCMGGSPNPLRDSLNQNKSSIQTGLTAMENLQAYQQNRLPQPPSSQQVQEWIQEVNALTNSLGNVNLALEMMILAIRNINGGFSASCVTGLSAGMPLPSFPKNAFAMSSTGGGGGGKITADQLADYLKGKGVDPTTADDLALWADEHNLNLDDVQALLDSGADPKTVLSWLENGKLTEANLKDVTTLTTQGIDSDAITQLLNSGADLKAASADISALSRIPGVSSSDISGWIQKGLNLKYAKVLLDKGIDVNKLVGMYTKADPGVQRWISLPKDLKAGIANAIKRWSTGTYLTDASGNRVGNDGTPFTNRNNEMPGGTTPPYTEYRVNDSGMRIVVDANGKVYFSDHYNFSGGPGKFAALPVPFSWIMQLFQ